MLSSDATRLQVRGLGFCFFSKILTKKKEKKRKPIPSSGRGKKARLIAHR